MTIGSWDRSTTPGMNINTIGFVGVINQKTWGGEDRPPRVRIPRSYFTVFYKGKWYRFKKRASWEPREPRTSDEQHNYTMSENYSSSRDTTTNWGGVIYHGNTSSTQSGTGFNNSVLQTSPFDDNDQLKLINKLREKLQGSDFNASVFLGEGHQTLRMITDSAVRIRKAYVHLRRGDLAGTARSLFEGSSRRPLKPYSSMKNFNASNRENLANNWLELQYGWLPLLSDTQNLAELLAHQLQSPLEMKVSASRTKQASGISTPVYVGYNPTTLQYGFIATRWSKTERRKVTVFIKERPSPWAVLGLTDPRQVMWELLPWSFVADWFIPIGQYLDARGVSSIYPGQYVQGNLYKGRNYPSQGWTNLNGSANIKTMSQSGFYATYREHAERVNYTRTVSTSPAVPLPSFKGLAKAASWQHCVNAVALLTQQFAGKGK